MLPEPRKAGRRRDRRGRRGRRARADGTCRVGLRAALFPQPRDLR